MKAPTVRKFTDEFREAELAKGNRSLYYFAQAILGFDRLSALQAELCAFLQSPWRRAVIAVYRGGYKSTLTTQAYPLWRGLYIPDWSCKIIENSRENAMRNHVVPMIDLFISSPRADYLQWLYQHRIPNNFAGTNSDQIVFKKNNPLSMPTISYWGIDSRFEGYHGPCVILDDPEGADADKSDVPNEDSYRAYQRAIPLLEPPATGQILVVATSHGDNPLIWRLRERHQWESEKDNARSPVKFFWRAVIDSTGEPREPHRFPKALLNELALEPMYDQQYLLLKRRKTDIVFREDAIQAAAWEWVDVEQTVIKYPSFEYDMEELNETGWTKPTTVEVRVNVNQLRYFIHSDPTHKLDEQMKHKKKNRPSHNALVIVGVAPDGHAIVMGQWGESDDIADLTDEYIRLARLYNIYKGTFEATGAQIWFFSILKTKMQMMRQAQMVSMLRRDGVTKREDFHVDLLSKTVEANKTNETKEWLFRERLAPWINHGILHFNLMQNAPILDQVRNISDESKPIDFVDALSQGPEIWSAPIQGELAQARLSRRRMATQTLAEKRLNLQPSPYRGYGPN